MNKKEYMKQVLNLLWPYAFTGRGISNEVLIAVYNIWLRCLEIYRANK